MCPNFSRTNMDSIFWAAPQLKIFLKHEVPVYRKRKSTEHTPLTVAAVPDVKDSVVELLLGYELMCILEKKLSSAQECFRTGIRHSAYSKRFKHLNQAYACRISEVDHGTGVKETTNERQVGMSTSIKRNGQRQKECNKRGKQTQILPLKEEEVEEKEWTGTDTVPLEDFWQ